MEKKILQEGTPCAGERLAGMKSKYMLLDMAILHSQGKKVSWTTDTAREISVSHPQLRLEA